METKHITTIKIIIILIPAIITLFLINMNFLFDQEFNYHYNVGNKDSEFLNPSERISQIKFEGETNYKELMGALVYFPINIPPNAEKIKVEIKFKDNFPEGGRLFLGAKSGEGWDYTADKIFEKNSQDQNKWIVKEINYDLKLQNLDLDTRDNFFVIRTPHLGQEEYKNYTIPIDYINITIYKPGLLWNK